MSNPENTKLCDFTSTNNNYFIYTPIAPRAPVVPPMVEVVEVEEVDDDVEEVPSSL
jgi:hypothetical protein